MASKSCATEIVRTYVAHTLTQGYNGRGFRNRCAEVTPGRRAPGRIRHKVRAELNRFAVDVAR